MVFNKTLQIFVIVGFLILVACSETPPAAVSNSPQGQDGVEAVTGGQTLELMSLVYRGREPVSGRACTLYLSSFDGEFGSQVVARPELLIHGVVPIDMELDFYQYSLTENQFFAPDSEQADTELTLGAARLSYTYLPGDMNDLSQYEQDFTLLQSMRIDFNTSDYQGFKESLGEIVADPESFASHTERLNLMERIHIRIKHFDHYDPAVCLNFQLQEGLQKVEFIIGQEFEDN